MRASRQLGIFVRPPIPGSVKTRLIPALGEEGACSLYGAFLADLFRRLGRLKSTAVTVFHTGSDPAPLPRSMPPAWEVTPQEGADLGERLAAASARLLSDGDRAVIIGSDSPDIPIQYLRRAFQRLKHKDVVLGPANDGGYYLVGLGTESPELFAGVDWGTGSVLAATVENVRRAGLSLHMLPMWYDVDDDASLDVLRTMLAARRVEGRDRLLATEAALERLDADSVDR